VSVIDDDVYQIIINALQYGKVHLDRVTGFESCYQGLSTNENRDVMLSAITHSVEKRN
jgi:hypothetical protein